MIEDNVDDTIANLENKLKNIMTNVTNDKKEFENIEDEINDN